MNDSEPAVDYGTGVSEEEPKERRRKPLTWEERNRLQKATKALLLQTGVTDLECGRSPARKTREDALPSGEVLSLGTWKSLCTTQDAAKKGMV